MLFRTNLCKMFGEFKKTLKYSLTKAMNFKKLGNTDIEVSAICLGTMTWGEQNNQKDAFEQMDYALECGVNFFDTAEIYPSPCFENTYGSTEKIIGNWFKEKKIEIKLY